MLSEQAAAIVGVQAKSHIPFLSFGLHCLTYSCQVTKSAFVCSIQKASWHSWLATTAALLTFLLHSSYSCWSNFTCLQAILGILREWLYTLWRERTAAHVNGSQSNCIRKSRNTSEKHTGGIISQSMAHHQCAVSCRQDGRSRWGGWQARVLLAGSGTSCRAGTGLQQWLRACAMGLVQVCPASLPKPTACSLHSQMQLNCNSAYAVARPIVGNVVCALKASIEFLQLKGC